MIDLTGRSSVTLADLHAALLERAAQEHTAQPQGNAESQPEPEVLQTKHGPAYRCPFCHFNWVWNATLPCGACTVARRYLQPAPAPAPPPTPIYAPAEEELRPCAYCHAPRCWPRDSASDNYCTPCRERVSAKYRETMRRKAEGTFEDLQPRDWGCVMCHRKMAHSVARPHALLCAECRTTNFREQDESEWPAQDGVLTVWDCPQVSEHVNRRGETVVAGHVLRHRVLDESAWDRFGDTVEYAE